MNTYNITEWDKYLMLQNSLHYRVRFEVLDSNMKIINTVEGIVDGGNASIDSSSNVRRTLSLTCVPTYFYDNNMVLDPNGYIWVDKTVKFYIGIQDLRSGEYTYYPAGYYYYTNASGQYDTETNQLNLSLSDYMVLLDGTKNGQIGGVNVTEFPGYEEDEDTGKPIQFYKIRNAMIVTLSKLTYIKNYFIDEIGEPKCIERFNKNYLQYRKNHKNKWDAIPYDLEFNAGSTLYDIVAALRDLYPNYETFFEPINNHFICQLIPSHEDDPIFLDDNFFQHILLSEDTSTDLTSIYNVCEVWGESIDAEYYADTSTIGNAYDLIVNQYANDLNILQAQYNALMLQYIQSIYDSNSSEAYRLRSEMEEIARQIAALQEEQRRQIALLDSAGMISDHAYIAFIKSYPSSYKSGSTIAIRITKPNIGKTAYLQIRSGMHGENVLGAIPIFKKESDKFIKPMTLEAGGIYVFRIEHHYSDDLPDTIAYLLGMWQVHAVDALSNGEIGDYFIEKKPVKDSEGNIIINDSGEIEYTTHIPVDVNGNAIKMYSEQYFRYKYNCEHVHITVVPDSPFVVQKLGEILYVEDSGDGGNSDSDYLALENAKYINWQNSRLTDIITIQTLLIPFLDVNTKVSYRPQRDKEAHEYIVKNISHDLGSMTSSITMYRFYPLLNSNNVIEEDE